MPRYLSAVYFISLQPETITVSLVLCRSYLRPHCNDQFSTFTQHLILTNRNTILQPLWVYELLAVKQTMFLFELAFTLVNIPEKSVRLDTCFSTVTSYQISLDWSTHNRSAPWAGFRPRFYQWAILLCHYGKWENTYFQVQKEDFQLILKDKPWGFVPIPHHKSLNSLLLVKLFIIF